MLCALKRLLDLKNQLPEKADPKEKACKSLIKNN